MRFRGSVTAIYGYCRLLQNAPKEEEGYLSLETAFCQQHAQGEELGGMAFVLHIDWICAPQLSSDQYDTVVVVVGLFNETFTCITMVGNTIRYVI